MPLTTITCIEDLRRLAKLKVPKMFYDYADSGSWTEQTYRANSDDFKKIHLKQKVAVNLENRSTTCKMLGQEVSMPCALAPIGIAGMQRADGEILAAKAAERFNVPFILSTMSICSIEDVAANVDKPFWFQLYCMRDHDFSNKLIRRAKDAGCSALVLTLDLQLLGQRHKDLKNGLTAPPKPTLLNVLDLLCRPEWCYHMLQTKRKTFGNIVNHVPGLKKMDSLAKWTHEQFDLGLDWNAIRRIQEWWGGKLIVKGIMSPEDAEKALSYGVDAIVVSNHGGRQLDGAKSSISMLPEIAKVVGKKSELWMDGGITTGQDMLKAIALGACGTLIGRAYIYGLGALGQAGVSQALELLHKELDLSMAFCGHTNINTIDAKIIETKGYV